MIRTGFNSTSDAIERLLLENYYNHSITPNSSEYYDEEDLSDYTRIVNGYDPLERPWMALIVMNAYTSYNPPSIGRSSICGGSLLNEL